ncbi:MAG TPA: cysteine synthase family protein [Candidatus Methylomirabilis sp.]|nr:cysteine synthase family protein [Candidatus Methylomirabilis sp.]
MRNIESTAETGRPAVWSLIGNTPLVRVGRLEPHPGVEVHAKLESRNPGGSVKDRAAAAMILDGLRTGALRPGKTLLDSTSGNTGIAYAMLGASLGYPVTLCVPSNVTEERKRLLHVYGAEVIWTSPMEGSDGAIRLVRQLYAEHHERYFYPDQYNNEANWRAHYETTGPEILAQIGGRITHFVAGLGTSGTFVGTGRRLRDANPGIRLISVQPDSPLHGLEGLKHMDTAIVPGIYDPTLADDDARVETGAAWDMLHRLAREEGLFVGASGAAALVVASRVAQTLDEGVVVAIIPDGGERYLSDRMLMG